MTKNLIFLHLFLMISLISFGQRSSAIQNLQKARELHEKNRDEKALVHLNECIKQLPDNAEALFLRARIFSNQKEFLKALTDYNALLSLHPEDKEAFYSRGIIRYQLEQYSMALEDFIKCVELPSKETNTAYFKMDPTSNKAAGISTMSSMDIDVWNYTGLCYYRLDQPENAMFAFNSGLEAEPLHTDLLINRALVYEQLGQLEKARFDYKTILQHNPDHNIASINILRLQSSDEKLQSLNSYIIQHPEQSIGYADRGLAYHDAEDYEKAESDLVMAYQIDPDNIENKMNLALTKLKLDKLAEAEKLFLEISEKDHYSEKAYFNLGNVKFKQNNYEEAISFYTLAINFNSNNPSYLHNRSLAYYENNEIEKACEDMKIAQLMNPEIGVEFAEKYCSEN